MNLACTRENIEHLCRQLQTPLSEERFFAAAEGLEAYLGLIVKWNRVMNLVGPDTWEGVLTTLVADSFYLVDFIESLALPAEPEGWDLGAGAGLPGVPLRLFWQRGHYTLVEAREKRALFLRTVLSTCFLADTGVFQGRAEKFMQTRPPADVVISRAFLPWEKVLSLVEPHITHGGIAVFLTLTPAPEAAPHNWKLYAQREYQLAGSQRYFWAFQKV